MEQFGDRLRKVRIIRNITQEQLAEMADIARTMIGRYETTSQMPSLSTLVRIADVLGVSTDYLLGRTDAYDRPYIPPKETVRVKTSRKMPKNTEELELFVHEIMIKVLTENNLLD